MTRIFSALLYVIALLPQSVAAVTVFEDDVQVFAQHDSAFGHDGAAVAFMLEVGQVLSITTDPMDIWSLEGSLNVTSSAVGDSGLGIANVGVFSAPVGSLVGKIGGGDFFLVGHAMTRTIEDAGELRLFAWDPVPGDNGGFIAAHVTVLGESIAEVPIPGGFFGLLTALVACFATSGLSRFTQGPQAM